jgi:hypothetical protein
MQVLFSKFSSLVKNLESQQVSSQEYCTNWYV